jgi:hypothetical protein
MEEIVECTSFRAGPQPALKRALKELGKELGYDEIEKMEIEKMNGEILLPDGRRIVCNTFFDNVNFDNLCVKCIISE